MRKILVVVPAVLLLGCTSAQNQVRPEVGEPLSKVPPVDFRTAFGGYRPFAEQEMRDWRRANDEVGAAGGHAGHRPGQGAGQQTSEPQPGAPESSGGHGGHK